MILTKQNIEKQQFSIFIRDLSSHLNINLKHIIEDIIYRKEDEILKNKKNKNKNKKKKIKKKDLIIQEQNKLRYHKNIDEDNHKIKFLFQNLEIEKPFDSLIKLKTIEGQIKFKFLLLETFWNEKKKYIHYIILLYFELKDISTDLIDDKNKELLDLISLKLKQYDTKLFMMEKIGYLLPPLNNFQTFQKLDDWQENTIQIIQKKESAIVKAPTSSGKTFIAMSTGIIHKKILYVCPAKPVAYQVGAHFIHMGYKVHFFVENLSHYSYDSKTNIFIGTPHEIENNLYKLKEKFDYAVFDEIHNLNKEDDGDVYENIIKLIQCNFIALSATIKNIEFLKNKFTEYYPTKKIHYIEYNKRFINHQKWLWEENQLIKLHPLSGFKNMNEEFVNNSLSFTPNDCATLWNIIEEYFEDYDDELIGCSPDEYFVNDELLTLDDCCSYEFFLKKKLFEFNKKYPEIVQKVFHHFHQTPCLDSRNLSIEIISFIKTVKKKDMLPMIMFHTDENICKDLFHMIFNYLDKKELEEYPFHYLILEKKDELYKKYTERKQNFESKIKITNKNSQFEIQEKITIFEKKEKNIYITSILNFYQQKINKIKNNTEISEVLCNLQVNNLEKEMNSFIQNPDFNHQDIFQKHPDFIFNLGNQSMSGDKIREIRKEIYKTLGIKISYEDPLFQMLKRGIGIYTENMPDEYNWILQKLLATKEIGIIISDRTLCLGIDLPTRTTCFLGLNDIKFSKDEYLQMSGRSGRRGHDNQGNIIFYGNIDYLSLIDGNLPDIIGSTNPINTNYNILKDLNKFLYSDKIFKNFINDKRKIIKIESYNKPIENHKLLWYLRKYEKSYQFINQLDSIESELFLKTNQDQEVLLINHILEFTMINSKIFSIYKLKKLNDKQCIPEIKEFIHVLLSIYNNIHQIRYKDICNTSKRLFSIMNIILFTNSLTIN